MTVEADRGALAFAEKLLSLLGEGHFTATYKYAVILGLMDLCMEHSSRTGAAPTSVTTRQLAEKVLELYWPHTLPFRGEVLEQNSGRQARILTETIRFRREDAADPCASLHKSRLSAPEPFKKLLDDVEWTLVKMPLPKLQRIGNEVHPFIYRIQWDDDVRIGEFHSLRFDNLIRFVGQAPEHMVRLSGFIRPLVKREWTHRVAHLNRDHIDDLELEDFLFGARRLDLKPVRRGLHKLQNGRCFYCRSSLDGRTEVDHFIPWSRYPDNGIENLVVAHGSCNHSKRDHLAAARHVARWMERTDRHEADLAEIAERASWDRHAERSISVARSIYLRLPTDSRLWLAGETFVPASRTELRAAFGS